MLLKLTPTVLSRIEATDYWRIDRGWTKHCHPDQILLTCFHKGKWQQVGNKLHYMAICCKNGKTLQKWQNIELSCKKLHSIALSCKQKVHYGTKLHKMAQSCKKLYSIKWHKLIQKCL